MPTIAFACILAAALAEGSYLFRKDGKLDPFSPYLLSAAVLLILAELVRRSVEIRFVAITSLYESLLLYAAGLAAIIVAYRRQRRLAYRPALAFAATVLTLGLLALSSSPLAPRALLAPIPALRSGWLVLHVSFAFVGEAFFAAAAIGSLAWLLSRDPEKRRDYDRFSYTAIAAGYPIFTFGALIFGAIWAQSAWGRWWSWDPKEVWAAVTWLVYTAFLHLRLVAGKKGRAMAILSLAGFALTLFTLFGVNFLIKGGLHSYS
jgi:ABC-type transport system involved in cytochrome c biogenesis, permease component